VEEKRHTFFNTTRTTKERGKEKIWISQQIEERERRCYTFRVTYSKEKKV